MIIEVEKDCPFNPVSLYAPWCMLLKVHCYSCFDPDIPADCPLKKGDVVVRFKKEK